MDFPVYVWLIAAIGVVGIPAATIGALVRGGRAVGLARRVTTTLAVVAAIVWTAWIAVSFLLADAGAYQQDAGTPARWALVIFVAVLTAVLLATRIPIVARILADPGTPARLAVPHTFRVAGGVFLVVLALGELPAVFAVPAGVGDIAIGVTAPLVAWRLSRRGDRRGAVWFNLMGIADLLIAVGVAYFAGLGATNLLNASPTTEAVSVLPLVLVPTTAVPLAVALHVISLRHLRGANRATAQRTLSVTG